MPHGRQGGSGGSQKIASENTKACKEAAHRTAAQVCEIL